MTSLPGTPQRHSQQIPATPPTPSRVPLPSGGSIGRSQVPLQPMPPSASNFINQNVFPSPNLSPFNPRNTRSFHSRSHMPPRQQNFPQPNFHQPYFNQFPQPYYSQSYPYPYPYQYQPPPHSFPHPQHLNVYPLPDTNMPPTPLLHTVPLPPTPLIHTVPLPRETPTFVPTVPTVASIKTFPSVTHIHILSGRQDFGAWDEDVRALIRHLGLTGHICDPPISGTPARLDHTPSYPPTLPSFPTEAETLAYQVWWDNDNVASHILHSRLSAAVRALLPSDDDHSATPRTARDLYRTVRSTYSLRGHTSSSALYTELRALTCGSRVQEYVMRWRAGISQLCTACYPLSFRDVIETFLEHLPSSIPYQFLRLKTMDDIDNIDVDDISAFLQITDKVLDIDSTYRRFNPPRVPSNIPRVNHVTPATAPPVIPSPRVIPPTSSSSAPHSSLTCSNCKRVGHLAATCFQAGGWS